MKTITLPILIAIGFLLNTCDIDKTVQLSITGKLINIPTCKINPNFTSELIPDSISRVEYSFDDSSNILNLKHLNAGLNCCPDSLYCEVSLINDTIIIKECELSALCNCSCLYDMEIQLDGVDAKKYQIKFIEPYSGEQAKLIFEIDLANFKAGSYSITRKQYPWGMNSLIQ